MILGAIVLVIVGVLVVNYFKQKGDVNIPANSTTGSSVNEHVVTEGESLWSISENAYGSGYNWTDIKNANSLTSDSIEIGQKLVIPDDVSAKQPTTTNVTESKIEVTDQNETTVSQETVISGDTYTVVKGDCLWNIAVRAYGDGYKWTEIAEANNLKNPDVIHSGNQLVLPR